MKFRRKPRFDDSSHGSCAICGRPLKAHEHNIRFRLPDPVLAVPEAERAERTWGNDVLMQVQEVGPFVRVILPLHFESGEALHVGTWLSVHPDKLREAWEVWNAPEYADLVLEGVLANAVPPWSQILAKPAVAKTVALTAVPFIVSSPDAKVQRLLNQRLPAESLREALAAVQ